jgi:hypothetical protein
VVLSFEARGKPLQALASSLQIRGIREIRGKLLPLVVVWGIRYSIRVYLREIRGKLLPFLTTDYQLPPTHLHSFHVRNRRNNHRQ